MPYNLADMARRANPGIRRKAITLRDIRPPAMLATDLYRSAYAPIITAWTNALPRIEAAYAQALSELVTDSAADIAQDIDSAASEVNRLLLVLTPALQRWALRVEAWQRRSFIGAVLSATSVDISQIIGPEDARQTVAASIEWNASLVRDVSDQARQRIANAAFDGLRNRTPAREVAKTIRDAVGMGRSRSINVAADQMQKLAGALSDERRRVAGITAWEWIWSHKTHGREAHIARDGKYYSDVAADVGKTLNGKELLAIPSERPSVLPFCGCRSRGVIDLSDD